MVEYDRRAFFEEVKAMMDDPQEIEAFRAEDGPNRCREVLEKMSGRNTDEIRGTMANLASKIWAKAFLDVQHVKVDGRDPVEARAFLKGGDDVLSETWLGQLIAEHLELE